jgi:uncharacterized protein (DUF1501 family)
MASGGTLSRRRFLQLAGGSLAALGTTPMWVRLGPAWAEPAPAGGRKLVVVLLDGGNDGLNTLIPYGSSAYYAARPTLAYKPDQVLKLPDSAFVGLNPSLPTLAQLYGERKVAVVQGVGYDHPDLSHFASMDIWQTGSPKHEHSTGWLGRYLDRTPEAGGIVRAVAIGNSLPTALQGAEESGVAVPSFGGFTFYDGGDSDPASEPYRLHETFLRCSEATLDGDPARAYLSSTRKTVTAVRAINNLGDPSAPPPATLADQMGMAITLLASDLGVEIAFLSLGSFDDHAAQGSNHPQLLKQVDDAIARFRADVTARGNPGDYLLMTFSEFGRRVQEDGSAGTDHGTAAPMFLVGDGVAGGLYGEHPGLEPAALDEDKNLVRTVEFREAYSTVLDGWLRRAPSAEVLGTKPGEGLHPVGFLR